MGNGGWDASTYSATTRSKINTGTTFGYSTATSYKPRGTRKAHEDLDPKKVNGPTSPLAGQNIRESRDSDEHPNSVPVAVFFDETGSMGNTPRVMQTKLAELFGLLLRKGYVEDPQIMVGGYGDAVWDEVALQVSQFESDNRVDDALDNIFLESGGGGNGGEHQSLAWYFTAYHTATDAWEKRQKKGYAFFIGDETALQLEPGHVAKFIGDGEPLGPIDNKGLVKKLLEKWEAYVFVINNASAQMQGSIKHYTELFGADRVLVVESEEAIAETIALTIGMTEGVIDLDDGVDDLKEIGASDAAIRQATNALQLYKGRATAAVTEAAPSDLDSTADDDTSVRI